MQLYPNPHEFGAMIPTAGTTPSTLPPRAPTTSLNRRKIKYAKAFGYLLNPYTVYEAAMKDGTAIEGQPGRTFAMYRNRLAMHCGIQYDDLITVRDPDPDMPPIYCIVAATNLSKRSEIPRMDIIEKAKEFLETREEPKWYYIVRA